MINILESVNRIQNFVGDSLTLRISEIEGILQNKNKSEISQFLQKEVINTQIINSAFSLKLVINQINVLIHALGILLTLPKILNEDEKVETLSLGAGNTGKPFDLETTFRIAEFKFINWKGGSESIRQNSLFKDFYLLAESDRYKRKELYVFGKEIPLKFLNGNRAIESVLSKNNKLLLEFRNKYQNKFIVVKDYYDYRKNDVRIINLYDIIPEIKDIIELKSVEEL